MVGNAVPPNLAYFLAKQIYADLNVEDNIQNFDKLHELPMTQGSACTARPVAPF